MRLLYTLAFAAAAGFCPAPGASAQVASSTLTFDQLPAGTVIGAQYYLTHRFLILGDNARVGAADTLTLFGSGLNNNTDHDLEQRNWTVGNLVGSAETLGNLLIIAENTVDRNGDGLIDQPDDEYYGGTLTFISTRPLASFGFDLLGVRDDYAQKAFVEFYSGGTLLRSIGFPEFTTPGSPFYDPTLAWTPTYDLSGEVLDGRSGNRVQPVTAAGLGSNVTSFDSVVFRYQDSIALDNVNFTLPVATPEPGSIAMLGLASCAALLRRRRGLPV
jgi:hypothetical protein